MLQSRLRGVAMGFFVLCLILLTYVAYGSCKSYLQVRFWGDETSALAPNCLGISLQRGTLIANNRQLCHVQTCCQLCKVILNGVVPFCLQSWLGFLPMNIVMTGVSAQTPCVI